MQRIDGLKEFLEKKPEVIFAYLFGRFKELSREHFI